jgi:hypothetical protein
VEERLTRDETKQLLMRIMSAYPNFKPQSDLNYMIETWWEYLQSYSYEQCKTALHTYVVTNNTGFAPSIGQLIDNICKVTIPRSDDVQIAWTTYRAAISDGAYHAEEWFYGKFTDELRAAVGSPNVIHQHAINEDFNEDVVYSNFRRAYETVVKRKEEMAKMPPKLRSLIESVNVDANRLPQRKEEPPKIEQKWQPMSEESKSALERLKAKLN